MSNDTKTNEKSKKINKHIVDFDTFYFLCNINGVIQKVEHVTENKHYVNLLLERKTIIRNNITVLTVNILLYKKSFKIPKG